VIYVILLNEKRRNINFKDDETYFFVKSFKFITFKIFFILLYIFTVPNN